MDRREEIVKAVRIVFGTGLRSCFITLKDLAWAHGILERDSGWVGVYLSLFPAR